MKKGFTLIEMLVVILIIGILVAVAVPQYKTALQRVKFGQLQAMAEQILRAEQVYYMANGQYTNDYEALDIQMPARPGALIDKDGNVHPYPPAPYPSETAGDYLAGNGDRFFIAPKEYGVMIVARREDLPASYMMLWAWEKFKIRSCNVPDFADNPQVAKEAEKLCRAAGANKDEEGTWLF